MIYMTGNELRKKFLQFFASKDHLVLQSFPLIPENDPTLLLIGAGMAPFKPFFTGKMKPPHPRISTSQKCVRTGDIENVGRTARHHTFFEMLGNFSFGDYFKKEAISWAWEFLTEWLELPKDKLWVTIHPTDDEAFEIWKNDIGINEDRIIRLEDNFWEIGSGPCGPCSEIYFDLGEERGCGQPDCAVGCDCDRFLEIWNLVFTQFDRDDAGNYQPLAKKNIDTGAGLERIASVLQNKRSNFETDLLFPIIEYAANLAKVEYGRAATNDVSLKVIADHARSLTFMIADGILPSNEGRGYVLRRVLRRAVRHARLLGIEKPFLAAAVDVVVTMFAESYPDIAEKKDYIKKVIQLEEERFHTTLTQGMELLNEQIVELEKAGKKILDGTTAFKLYDTFGFPWELTAEILNEHAIEFDKVAFDTAMNEQRVRARSARQDHDNQMVIPDISGLNVEQLRRDPNAYEAKIVLMWKDGVIIEEANDGDEVAIVLDVTPFYAEGGGQIGDSGFIYGNLGKVEIETAKKLPNSAFYHVGRIVEGVIKTSDHVKIELNCLQSQDSARNHTATHLLHSALKAVLGDHVNQAGSLVGADRLRFDFSHFTPVTYEQLAQVEKIVNEIILQNAGVSFIETTQEIARDMGATALFGEKYGDLVRVVIVDGFSKELCGGMHVTSTAEIGTFRIISESGIGSGIRRIEAVTGREAVKYTKEREDMLTKVAELLKTRPDDVVNKLEGLMTKVKDLEHEISALHAQSAKAQAQELLKNLQEFNDVQYVVAKVNATDMDGLRNMADMVRDHLDNGIVVLGAVTDGKVNFVAMATKEAIAKKAHAGNIVKEAAKVTGGGGGGRPDMAQAGGKNPDKINDALQVAEDIIKQQLK
ncbi:Alanine--tRNA ligase [bioreactor metagenome]|uniref:Alanine--tRNA ligase n=1 Tax=bioreactor metagenome TaxID=1076179 RepID=A0A644UZE8_9ZZZZ